MAGERAQVRNRWLARSDRDELNVRETRHASHGEFICLLASVGLGIARGAGDLQGLRPGWPDKSSWLSDELGHVANR